MLSEKSIRIVKEIAPLVAAIAALVNAQSVMVIDAELTRRAEKN